MGNRPDPISVWREQYARRWLNLDFKPEPDTPFHVSVEPIFDDLRIARTTLSPGTAFRDEELVRDGDDVFSFIISQSTSIDVTHHRRELRLTNGDATVMHVCGTGAGRSRHNLAWIGVFVPPSELDERGARPGDALMRWLPRQNEALQLLRSYLRSVERNRLGATAEMRETIRRHVIDLVTLAITSHAALGESTLGAIAAARLNAALDHIAECYGNPELSVGMVASNLGISPRYLQQLLETSGMSFTAHVNDLRLQQASRLLTEGGVGRRIADIALEVGYSDISHFNRLFRNRFGDTPSAYRKGTK